MGEWKEKVDAAYDMVHALCQPRGSEGSRQWSMSIPAREDYDPDLVITSGLMAAEKEIAALTAERDRLAAENAELKSCLDIEKTNAHDMAMLSAEWADAFAAANATLDRLREVVPKVLPPHMSWKDSLDGARSILYPPETTNDDR